jgi:hypothetical protein
VRLDVYGPAEELEKLKEPLNPAWFTLRRCSWGNIFDWLDWRSRLRSWRWQEGLWG